MKVLHVITSLSRSSGGPSRSVQGLVAGLNAAGVEAWLMTLVKGEGPWVDGVSHFINGESFESVLDRVKPDIVHLHCIWSLALHRCAVICRRKGIPYVIAPRGMLEPWSLKQKWLKKRIARFLYQDRDLKCAAALHATAESEAEQFRRLGFKNPVIVSPNGVNVPKAVASDQWLVASGDEAVADTTRKRRVLFVSRMHPKKGVMELVEAWKLVVSGQWLGARAGVPLPVADGGGTPSLPGWATASVVSGQGGGANGWVCELVYTVSGELEREYELKVKARVKELGLEDRVVFTGALNDDEKWAAYTRADVFVLPTYSENFGIVVAEALWAGAPVITTKGTPWGELETAKCGKWIDLPSEGSNPSAWPTLVAALREMMSLSDDERRQMGANGRRLVEEKYTWDAVVKKMIVGYESVSN